MSVAKKQTRRFGMHPHMLMDVIKRQAGTLHKAILEAVMNAVDAKATEVHISLTSKTVTVRDNGVGITSLQHIEDFWEMFGQPPAKTEQKTYGQFRMGRGQLFAFGVNSWTTGTFVMEVDINNKGLDYDLTQTTTPVTGCTVAIRLYEELLPSDKAQLERELAISVKYVPCKIYFNEELLTTDVLDVEWDHETEDAYIKLKDSGNLYVFNLGVLVCSHPWHVFGCGGEVVSKKQLKVNFARNEVMSDCKVWRKVKPFVDKQAGTRAARQTTLTDDARQRLCDQFKDGSLDRSDITSAKLFTDVNGRHWALDQIQGYKWGSAATVCDLGDTQGKSIHGHRLAFVFAKTTLYRFGVKTLQQLLAIIGQQVPRFDLMAAKSFQELTAAMADHHELIPESDWNVQEQIVMSVLAGAIHMITQSSDGLRLRRLKIVVGDAESTSAWTDTSTFIAISRKAIAEIGTGLSAWITYGQMLICNVLANEANHKTVSHSPEYYEQVIDLCEDQLPACVDYCINMFPRAVERIGRALTKDQLRHEDRVAKHKQAESNLLNMTKPSEN